MSLDFSLYYKNDGHSMEAFSKNITHNLNKMAMEAGIYDALWHPKENGYLKGIDVVPILKKGLASLKEKPEHYATFNASNGWGSYPHFVEFVEAVLEACEFYPSALIDSDI
jgi:hypothetical protein